MSIGTMANKHEIEEIIDFLTESKQLISYDDGDGYPNNVSVECCTKGCTNHHWLYDEWVQDEDVVNMLERGWYFNLESDTILCPTCLSKTLLPM